MAAAMAELTRQNQELVRELNIRRQRRDENTGGQAQSQDGRNVEFESHSRGTPSRRVPHLEREMDQMRRTMDEMKESMKRMNPEDPMCFNPDIWNVSQYMPSMIRYKR